jgi:hypothetical protein
MNNELPQIPQIPIMTAPYEGAIIAIVNLATKVIESQSPEQQSRLWELHIKNIERWMDFWEGFGGIFKPKPPVPPAVK